VVTAAAVGPAARAEAQEAHPPRKGASVRPPDLDPRDVQAVDDDVLAGWDIGATDEEIAAWRLDRRPFPTDTVVVAVGAVLGGVLGSAVSTRRRPLGAGAGLLGGAVAAGAARRVWELRP